MRWAPVCGVGAMLLLFAGSCDRPQAPSSPSRRAALSTEDGLAVREGRILEALARLRPVLSSSHEGLHPVTDAEGRTRVDLKGRFGHAMVAIRQQDGSLRYECVDNVDTAERALRSGVPAPPP